MSSDRDEYDAAIKKAADQQKRKFSVMEMIEPVAREYQQNWVLNDIVMLTSIAISLKRIADTYEATEKYK